LHLPRRKKVLVYRPLKPFEPEHLQRAGEFLRQEGFEDIQLEANTLSAVRGSRWYLVLPFGDPLDFRHRVEISLLEIRYTVELLYTPLPKTEEWFFRQEAQMLQEYAFLEKAGGLREEEVRQELAYRIAEKTVQTVMRLFILALPVLFFISFVLSVYYFFF
jgi:hypothetical protein